MVHKYFLAVLKRHYHYSSTEHTDEEILWAPTDMPKGVHKRGGWQNCTQSKFLTSRLSDNIVCIGIDIKLFIIKSKTWNCEVNIDILPPDISLEEATEHLGNPKIWFAKYLQFWSLYLLPGVTSVRIGMFTKVSETKVLNYFGEYSSEFSVQALAFPAYKGRFRAELQVSFLQVVDLMFEAVTFTKSNFDQLSQDAIPTFTLNNWSKLSNVFRVLPQNNKNIKIYRFPLDMSRLFKSCKVPSDYSVTTTKFKTQIGPKERLMSFNTGLWLSIFKNYTIVVKNTRKQWWTCIQARQIKFTDKQRNRAGATSFISLNLERLHSIGNASTNSKAWIVDPYTSVNFVSCGEPQYEKLAFIEFIAVYDVATWTLIVIAGFSLAVNLQMSESRNQFAFVPVLCNFADIFKLLLEQGGGFGVYQSKVKTRPILGLWFFISIIISNAYKSTNVYNLVAPRKLIPLDKIEAIIKYKYQIFAEPSKESIRSLKFFLVDLESKRMLIAPHFIGIKALELDGINTLASSVILDINSRMTENDNKSRELSLVNHIMNHSKLPTFMLEILVKAKQRNIKAELENSTFIPWIYIGRVVVNKFSKTFHKCKNVALLLSDLLCRQLAKYHETFNMGKIYVGKQAIIRGNFRFTTHFSRLAPVRHVFKRVKSLESAGLWRYIPRLVENLDLAKRMAQLNPNEGANTKVAGSSLTGNILAVFIVFTIGMGLGVIVFYVELL